MAIRRDISPFLQRVRAFLLGREHKTALRFEKDLANRTQPAPNLPVGPAHKLSVNYYYKRDPRREVFPPTVLVKEKLLADKKEAKEPAKLPTPGKIHRWD